MVKRSTTRSTTGSARIMLAAGLLSVLALSGCASDADTAVLSQSEENPTTTEAPTTSTTSTTESSPSSTSSAVPTTTGGKLHEPSGLACRGYRNIIKSTASGSLSDAQAGERARQMNEDAASATAAVKAGTEDLMTALNEADAEAYVESANALSEACTAAGH